LKRNADTPPNPENLVEIKFTETIPDVSWYRHENWQPGQYKRFRHAHTMSQNITGFTFYNETHQTTPNP
jgi:hypothetical protein